MAKLKTRERSGAAAKVAIGRKRPVQTYLDNSANDQVADENAAPHPTAAYLETDQHVSFVSDQPKRLIEIQGKENNFTSEPVEEPVTKAVEKPVTKAVEKPVAKAVEKPVAKAVEKPVAKAVEEPVAKAVEEPVAKAVEKPVTKAVEEPVTKAVEKPVTKAVSISNPKILIFKKENMFLSDDLSYAMSSDSLREVLSAICKMCIVQQSLQTGRIPYEYLHSKVSISIPNLKKIVRKLEDSQVLLKHIDQSSNGSKGRDFIIAPKAMVCMITQDEGLRKWMARNQVSVTNIKKLYDFE